MLYESSLSYDLFALLARGRRIAYGTNDGVYFADMAENHREPMKMLALPDVWQLDIMDEYELLIVLTGTYPSFILNRSKIDFSLICVQKTKSPLSF